MIDELNDLLEEVPDGLLIADDAGRILLVNRSLEEMFGYQRSELLGQPLEILVPDGLRERHREHRQRYRAAPHRRPMGLGMELSGRRKDGTTFAIEISLSPWATRPTAQGEPAYVAIARDVSERIATQQMLAATRQRLAVADDRERIARDLHDKVIQRLFATGLSLQGVAGQVERDTVRDRLNRAVDELDDAIRDIRTAIFALHTTPTDEPVLRSGVLQLVSEMSGALGFTPAVRFDGPIDSIATPAITEAALSTLREILSNVVRHAAASKVTIDLRAHDGLQLIVRDDGVGVPADAEARSGNGLRNMRRRATALGGDMTIAAVQPSGTEIAWSIPDRT